MTRGRGTRAGLALLVVGSVFAVLAGSVASAAPGPDGGPPAAAGRYIVVLADGVDVDRAASDAARAEGAQVDLVYRSALRGYAATMSEQAAANLTRDPRVVSVEPDQVVTAFGEVPTGVDRSEADQKLVLSDTSTVSYTASSVDVAVLDSGIDDQHPDLNVVGGANCAGGGPRSSSCIDGLPGDGNGHGTHVAGTIGAIDHGDGRGVVGMAPGIGLHAVRVLGNNGSGYMSWIAAGIDWVTAHNLDGDATDDIEVINMSLGCKCSSSALDTAIDGATTAGVVVVVAAGNDNADAKDFSPAKHEKVIAVGALADFDGKAGGAGASTCRADQDDTRADFSNYGSMVDIAAPGVCISSTWPGGGYNTISGTSMASPHVAGAAAVYLVEKPTEKNADRWSAVRTGLTGTGWSVAPAEQCGYAVDGKSIGNLLLLATPCAWVDPGSGGGGGGGGSGDGTPAVARVTEIAYSTSGKGGQDLNVTVTLADGAGARIGGATVGVTLTNTTTSTSYNGSSTTNANGQVTFKLRRAPAGTYTTKVDTVSPASLGWDGNTPTNSYDFGTATGSGRGVASARELIAA